MAADGQGGAAAGSRLDTLQILRFVAAFAVVLFHLVPEVNRRTGGDWPTLIVGRAGVDIFFVISGFIIAHTTSGRREPIGFLKRRLFRILPLYWALTLALFSVALVKPDLLKSTTADVPSLIKSLFFIPYVKGNGQIHPVLFLGWTLNYEMFFYLAYTLALAVTRRPVVLVSVLFTGIALAGAVLSPTATVPMFYSRPIILEFLFGLWIFELWQARPALLARAWPLAIVGTALLLVQNGAPAEPVGNIRWLIYGVPSALILAGMLSLRAPAGFPGTALIRLGDASYSMYLIHPYIIGVLVPKLLGRLGHGGGAVAFTMVLATALVFAASLALFMLLERPSNAWLRKHFAVR